MTRRLPPLPVLFAYLSGAFGLAITAQVNFLVPLRARELGADFSAIGLIIGAGAAAGALMSITSGALIDRLGARRAFLASTGLTAVLSLALFAVTDYWWFLIIQPLLGVSRNAAWIASQSHVTSLSSEEERPRNTGRFGLFSHLGQMAGPLLVGAAASAIGFRWAMLVPVVYSLLFLTIGLGLSEAQSRQELRSGPPHGAGLRSALGLVSVRGIQVALLLSFARLWTTNVYSIFYPVSLIDGGIDPAVAGAAMATSGFVAAGLAPTAGFVTRSLSPQLAITLGLACNAVGLLVAPFAGTLPLAFLVPVLVGIGTGVSLPLLISVMTTAAPPTQRGVALGLRGMVNQTAAMGAPVAIGPIMTLGLRLGFMTGGTIGLVLLVVAAWVSARPAAR